MKTKTILLFTLAILTITANTIAQNVPSYIPTNGLVGWWPFNGNANDESGNGNDAVMQGNATFTLDRYSDANSSYAGDLTSGADITSLNNFPFGNSERTISLWFQNNVPYPGGNSQLFSFGDNNSGGRFGLFMDGSYIGVEHVNGGRVCTYTPDGNWHNLVVTYPINGSGTNDISVYFDGIGQASQSFNPVNLLNTANSSIHWIGALGFAPGWLYAFSGKIDDIAIWNRALTQQEVTALYTASSTNNNETSNTTANVPGAISYQAVARDAQGMPLADANLQVQFTLIADSLSGAAEYVETHTLFTNSLGLFTTAFGAGTPVSNTFGNINWTDGNKFVNVQIDAGNGWIDMGTQQLLSTPYSMHSATSGTIKNPGLPVFADNAAAIAGGLVAGDMYRTASGDLKIVY